MLKLNHSVGSPDEKARGEILVDGLVYKINRTKEPHNYHYTEKNGKICGREQLLTPGKHVVSPSSSFPYVEYKTFTRIDNRSQFHMDCLEFAGNLQLCYKLI